MTMSDAELKTAQARWRAETPGCATRLHLNNAGASLMPAVVKDAITAHLGREALEGGYEAADAAAAKIATAYEEVASLVGAGVFSVLLVLARTPGVQEMIPLIDFFHTALVVHVNLTVLIWLLSMDGVI